MGSEAGGLWRSFRSQVGPYGRLTRIENRCELGTPDVAYTFRTVAVPRGASGWIELKHVDEWPKRPTTPLRIDHLTLDQVLWLEAERDAGGRAWMLLQVARDYHLLDATETRAVYERRHTRDSVAMKAALFWGGPFPVGTLVKALVS